MSASLAQLEIGYGPPPKDPSPLDLAFDQFHREHPRVYEILVALARQAVGAGERIGMRCLWENMRWKLRIVEKQGGYVFNDHHAPRYARLIAKQEADLADLFETRASKYLEA